MASLFILFPVVLALVALAIPSNRHRPWTLAVAGVTHSVLTVRLLLIPSPSLNGLWLAIDPLGRLTLVLISGLFLCCAWYAVGYLRYRQERSNRIFCACLLFILAGMDLVIWANHLGLMWVAVEAVALATGPLIYFNRTPQSIEATWKYLIVGSVGVAVALLGTFFLAYACVDQGLKPSLMLGELLAQAPKLSKPWLHAAFTLLLVGYGTKMGLAPMHTWKPDAYGEAPGLVGALLAGGLTSCAFLAILRVYRICLAAGDSGSMQAMLLGMGLFSMAVAGIYMVGQRDFKRMLAYSSIEHMGILAFGIGIGGPALFGTLLHMLNNGLTKGVLFLAAGNIHRAYASKRIEEVHGALRRVPVSASLFLAGFIAITGSPPFGPFISEFAIFNAAFSESRYVVGSLYLLFMLLVFIGMGATVLSVVQGRAPASAQKLAYRDGLGTCLPIIVLLAVVLLLGLHIPAPITTLLNDAVQCLEVHP